MKFKWLKPAAAVLMALAMLFAPVITSAQPTYSNVVSIGTTMAVTSFFSLSASVSSVAFTYNTGSETATSPAFNVTASYALPTGISQIYVYGLVGSATAALANGSNNIPSNDVYLSINGATASPCSASQDGSLSGVGGLPGGNDQCGVWNPIQSGSPAGAAGSSSASYQLTMSGLPVLNVGTYTGTFILVGQYQ